MTIPACTATRSRDNAPCWMRQHAGRTHVTENYELFQLPTNNWTNVPLPHDNAHAPENLKP